MADVEQRITDFFKHYTPHTFKKGETIILGGHEPAGVFYICSGEVRQYAISEHTGATLTLHIYRPGNFFPVIWGLADKRNLYYFDALTKVDVYRASKEEVVAFLKNDPEALYSLTTRLAAGLNGMLMRLETYAFTDVYGRVISELLYLIKHYGTPHENGYVLPHFTHQQLADFVGSARETVTVVMDKLEKKELVISMGHNLYVIDSDALFAEFKAKRNR